MRRAAGQDDEDRRPGPHRLAARPLNIGGTKLIGEREGAPNGRAEDWRRVIECMCRLRGERSVDASSHPGSIGVRGEITRRASITSARLGSGRVGSARLAFALLAEILDLVPGRGSRAEQLVEVLEA